MQSWEELFFFGFGWRFHNIIGEIIMFYVLSVFHSEDNWL